jgi:hypothetical protein
MTLHLDRLAHDVVAPGLIRQDSPCGVDMTIALAHCLRENLHACTLCGTYPRVLDQVLLRLGTRSVAAVSCLACRHQDVGMQRFMPFWRCAIGATDGSERKSAVRHAAKTLYWGDRGDDVWGNHQP